MFLIFASRHEDKVNRTGEHAQQETSSSLILLHIQVLPAETPPSIKHLKGKKKDKQQCTTHYFKLLLFYIANRASHRTVCSGDPLSYVLNVTIVVSHNKLLEFEGRKYTYEMHSATSQCLAHTLWETVRPKNCSEEQMHLASHWKLDQKKSWPVRTSQQTLLRWTTGFFYTLRSLCLSPSRMRFSHKNSSSKSPAPALS